MLKVNAIRPSQAAWYFCDYSCTYYQNFKVHGTVANLIGCGCKRKNDDKLKRRIGLDSTLKSLPSKKIPVQRNAVSHLTSKFKLYRLRGDMHALFSFLAFSTQRTGIAELFGPDWRCWGTMWGHLRCGHQGIWSWRLALPRLNLCGWACDWPFWTFGNPQIFGLSGVESKVVISTPSAQSPYRLIKPINLVLSVNLIIELVLCTGMQPWVNREYRSGLSTQPWGTPMFRFSEKEVMLLRLTACGLCVRKSNIQLKRDVLMPSPLILQIRSAGIIVLKAELKSINSILT